MTHKFLSKTLYFVHNNGSAYLRSVLAGKYHKKYNLSLNFRHSFKSKGCPKFRLKDFPRQISTIFCYQSIKITWLLMIFIDFDFYLMTSLTNLGCNYTRNCTDTILKGGRWAATNLANICHQKILKKDKTVLKISLNSNKCLFLRLSVATQLSMNLLFACMNSVFIFWWSDEQMYLLI